MSFMWEALDISCKASVQEVFDQVIDTQKSSEIRIEYKTLFTKVGLMYTKKRSMNF